MVANKSAGLNGKSAGLKGLQQKTQTSASFAEAPSSRLGSGWSLMDFVFACTAAMLVGAVLFTAMQKMPAGYDEEHGDWKYFVVDGSTFKLLAAGRIDSCKSCHDQYAESAHVTRLYLKEKISSK